MQVIIVPGYNKTCGTECDLNRQGHSVNALKSQYLTKS